MNMATRTAEQEQKPAGRVLNVLGMQIAISVTAQQTGGAYVTAETMTPPQAGPPPHTHEQEDEAFFVLEGVFDILLGERTIRLSAGEHAFGPRGVPHTFRNVGSSPARILIIISPAGFERCLEELSQLPPGPPDIAKVTAICAKYGCKILV